MENDLFRQSPPTFRKFLNRFSFLNPPVISRILKNQELSLEDEEVIWRYGAGQIIAFLSGVIVAVIFGVRLVEGTQTQVVIWINSVVIAILFGHPFLLKVWAKQVWHLKLINWITVFSITALLMLRMYLSGGLGSPAAQWLGLVPQVALLVTGFAAAMIAFATISIGILAFVSLLPTSELIVLNTPSVGFVSWLVVMAFGGVMMAVEGRRGLTFRRFFSAQDKLKTAHQILLQAEKSKVLDALVATYNHEINNPLVIAMSQLYLLEKEIQNERVSKIKESLDRIATIVKKIDHIKSEKMYIDKYSNYASIVSMEDPNASNRR